MGVASVISKSLGLHRFLFSFFFFQAEDGIRDLTVTGVQTCALPIFALSIEALAAPLDAYDEALDDLRGDEAERTVLHHLRGHLRGAVTSGRLAHQRSEERRVGKECRSRWSPYH